MASEIIQPNFEEIAALTPQYGITRAAEQPKLVGVVPYAAYRMVKGQVDIKELLDNPRSLVGQLAKSEVVIVYLSTPKEILRIEGDYSLRVVEKYGIRKSKLGYIDKSLFDANPITRLGEIFTCGYALNQGIDDQGALLTNMWETSATQDPVDEILVRTRRLIDLSTRNVITVVNTPLRFESPNKFFV